MTWPQLCFMIFLRQDRRCAREKVGCQRPTRLDRKSAEHSIAAGFPSDHQQYPESVDSKQKEVPVLVRVLT